MTTFLSPSDPAALELLASIHAGAGDRLRSCLADRPDLATVRIGDVNEARSALHIATDWPGHFPNIGSTIELLVAAGADVDAPFIGALSETPLHWAASTGDLAALDALLECAAQVDAPGGVLTGGAALDDAIIFDMLEAARRLIDAGSAVRLFHAAALGMTEVVAELVTTASGEELDAALWHACHHGETGAGRLLLAAGAHPDADGFSGMTPLDAAREAGGMELVQLLTVAL